MKFLAKLTLFLLIFSTYSAQAKFVECSSCQSNTSFLNIAKANSDFIEGRSYVYVANSNSEVIRKFMVQYERGGMGEPTIFRVNPITVDSTTYNNFSEAMVWRNSVEEFFDSELELPNSVALSAWQLSGNSIFQRDIAIYYSNHQSLQQRLGNYTTALFTLGGKLIAANLTVSVKFGDNSSANYKIVGLDSHGNLEFEFMNAVDNLGNPIPTKISELSGQFRISKETASNMSNAASNFHFSFRYVPSPGTSVTITDCTIDPLTKEVTCIPKDKP
jgi:hypothetical protein